LNFIKNELDRKRIVELAYDNKVNEVLEKHAPYNNMHIPISEVNPLYINRVKNSNGELKSKSTFLVDDTSNDKLDRSSYLHGNSEFISITNSPLLPTEQFDKTEESMFERLNEISLLNKQNNTENTFRTKKDKKLNLPNDFTKYSDNTTNKLKNRVDTKNTDYTNNWNKKLTNDNVGIVSPNITKLNSLDKYLQDVIDLDNTKQYITKFNI